MTIDLQETADEGQGGGDPETPVVRMSSPKRDDDPSSSLTVKDLMLGVIEMQLMKNQGKKDYFKNHITVQIRQIFS